MVRKRLTWIHVGMAVAVGCFIAIAMFARDNVPLMLAFAVVLVVWAVVAEYAIVRAETAERENLTEPASRTAAEPLLH